MNFLTEDWDTLAKRYFQAVQRIATCDKQHSCAAKASRCREVPQFRPLGTEYLRYRIAVVSENPGGVVGMDYAPDDRLVARYREFTQNMTLESWQEMNGWLLDDAMPYFGQGKYLDFLTGIGLTTPHLVAHLTLAYCRTDNDNSKRKLIRTCFPQHTRRLIRDILRPHLIIAVGHPAYAACEQLPQSCHLIASLHWHQYTKDRQEQLKRRLRTIRSEVKRYMKHVDSGQLPGTFEQDSNLLGWPRL